VLPAPSGVNLKMVLAKAGLVLSNARTNTLPALSIARPSAAKLTTPHVMTVGSALEGSDGIGDRVESRMLIATLSKT
jgi:hypothetical protein